MATFDTAPLLDALSAPLGALIAAVGRGVADAQREMDAASMAALREIYASNEGVYRELQAIGYRPTWYHIPEVESDLQIALTVTGQETAGGSGGTAPVRLYAAPVDAGYASRFNFALQASSRVRFRIVPVPPSNAADAVRVVPALVGLTLGEARTRLLSLDIPATLPASTSDAQVVTSQTPAPGTVLPSGTTVTLGL
jgi:hypothetical protein